MRCVLPCSGNRMSAPRQHSRSIWSSCQCWDRVLHTGSSWYMVSSSWTAASNRYIHHHFGLQIGTDEVMNCTAGIVVPSMLQPHSSLGPLDSHRLALRSCCCSTAGLCLPAHVMASRSRGSKEQGLRGKESNWAAEPWQQGVVQHVLRGSAGHAGRLLVQRSVLHRVGKEVGTRQSQPSKFSR